jgi:putative transposase
VKLFFARTETLQEFIHIPTKQGNDYIEAFQSIVQREIIEGFEFNILFDAITIFKKHLNRYNNEKNHR